MTLTLLVVAVAVVVAGGAWWWLLHSVAPPVPQHGGTYSCCALYPTGAGADAAWRSEANRTYELYVPADCPRGAPIMLVLHGSNGDAATIRRYTGYEFERLADEHQFIVVYPEGTRGYWNDVRRKGGYAAKTLQIDDVGFLRALIGLLQSAHGEGEVFGVGFSNGGQMCLRMALDAPGSLDAVVLIAASMPTADNSESPPLDRPLPVMIINGTADPINPYDGGLVTIFGFGTRGTVLSSVDTAEYFASQLGDATHEGPDVVVPRSPDCDTWVDRREWRAGPGREVALVTVHGGGHVVPQPHYRFFRLAGPTELRFNAPRACWTFFGRLTTERRRT